MLDPLRRQESHNYLYRKPTLSASSRGKERSGSNETVSAIDESRGAELAEVGGKRARARAEAGCGGEVIALDASSPRVDEDLKHAASSALAAAPVEPVGDEGLARRERGIAAERVEAVAGGEEAVSSGLGPARGSQATKVGRKGAGLGAEPRKDGQLDAVAPLGMLGEDGEHPLDAAGADALVGG